MSRTKPGRRAMRRRMLERLPKGAVGAEIGVWQGRFSAVLLEVCRPRLLHLIDPWRYDPRFPGAAFGRARNAGRMDAMHDDVAARFAGDPRVRIHRAASEVALTAMADAVLDWAYVDGNHHAPYVGRDLVLCLRKVREGGVIAGDDYSWSDGRGQPVRDAVDALVDRGGLSLELIGQQYILRREAPGVSIPAG